MQATGREVSVDLAGVWCADWADMTAVLPTPLQATLRWLAAHTGFPARRLPASAETLLLLAAAAQEAEMAVSRPSTGLQQLDRVNKAAQRSHAIRRAQVHFKCDNSAKV